MDIFDEWRQKADEEFRNSDFWCDEYENGYGYEIGENGDVYLGNMHWIRQAVTPFHVFEDAKKKIGGI